ncbi:hypothetical protein, partial [Chromobacterium sphagni]|uniref:hypothetical protein n=1 Tax=Chromobacterium sphagni TaxID=1903179 RepID=UPI0019D3DA8D
VHAQRLMKRRLESIGGGGGFAMGFDAAIADCIRIFNDVKRVYLIVNLLNRIFILNLSLASLFVLHSLKYQLNTNCG